MTIFAPYRSYLIYPAASLTPLLLVIITSSLDIQWERQNHTKQTKTFVYKWIRMEEFLLWSQRPLDPSFICLDLMWSNVAAVHVFARIRIKETNTMCYAAVVDGRVQEKERKKRKNNTIFMQKRRKKESLLYVSCQYYIINKNSLRRVYSFKFYFIVEPAHDVLDIGRCSFNILCMGECAESKYFWLIFFPSKRSFSSARSGLSFVNKNGRHFWW